MIREATVFDVFKIVELTKKFFDKSGLGEYIPWDETAIKTFVFSLLDSPSGIILLGDNSILAGVVLPHPFNNSVTVFQEFVWYAEDSNGVRLLRYAEDLLKTKGVAISTMVSLQSMPDISALYERLGYQKTEQTFIKRI